ncbi:GntR family transcriptional regulator [Arthrobacter cupressi]|uniref:DNA-binding transcriptional regulator, GntR family n=1 Tax=Arthrobacter cupressi TaxID=1045773 RepID=A0A1G8SK03_9MICC|nr:GntR family transcriptional regulator [Arthrobacter cupressi]NYD78478.1 DNA-binding GntR family transcriptional regulator [Arthrobacter cupressi]SDJ29569.1 DNA-binding transcriptional regulator, GntR family [Arthrobacter cupressi]
MAATEEQFSLEGRPTAQLIADHLREQIVRGTIRPGQQINESLVASQLNTSRGPLREALQRLCQEGILIYRRNYGVFVLEIGPTDFREIYSARETIESTAARILLDGGPVQIRDAVEVLKEIVDGMAKHAVASNWEAIAGLDMQFHSSFVAAAGNSRLNRIYKALATESRMCVLNLEVSYPRMEVLVEEHQDLLELLEAGDREGLLAAIKRHMREAVTHLIATQQEQGRP